MNKTSIVTFAIILICLFASPISYAQPNVTSEDLSNETLPESIVIDGITLDKEFEVISTNKDPFKPLVVKKVISYIRPVRESKTTKTITAEIKTIPPLKLKVTGICGNKDKRQVVLQYKNTEYTLDAGQEIKNKFKIMNINANQVTVYSIPESRRRTFKL